MDVTKQTAMSAAPKGGRAPCARVGVRSVIAAGLLAMGAAVPCGLSACSAPARTPRVAAPPARPSVAGPARAPDAAGAPTAPAGGLTGADVAILEEIPPTQWLVVERASDDAPGGWATGSFDKAHNKITIDTKDVTRFAINTARIPIDWERGVILRLNGFSSELRKRDYPILHFVHDEHGLWVVDEP